MIFYGGSGFMMLIIMAFIFMMVSSSARQMQRPRDRRQIESGYGHPWHRPEAYAYGEPDMIDPYGQQPELDAPMSDESRKAVDADITKFGDELRDLDLDVVGLTLNDEAQSDYTKALDAYENAKQALRNAQMESDVSAITQILEEGRYAITAVKARANNRPVPERRPPCFFDPAHGPSVTNVQWKPEGGVLREVPACALDAARVRSGANPHIRMVDAQRGAMVPYWEDPRQAAWARGYYGNYGMDPVIRSLTHGAVMFSVFGLLGEMFDD